MRHVYKIFIHNPIQLILLALVLFAAGCSLEKESKFNRGMQNLTTHYNILFNANDILRQKQENYEAAYIDAYTQLLSVYQDTAAHAAAADKELDIVITKANTIISTKEQSHYIGDAYLLLGKANHFYGHYFNAVEFSKYVTLSFPKNKDLLQEARVWEARSSLYLNQLPQAKTLIDSTLKNVNPKKNITADVYATATQFYIDVAEYPDAEAMAKQAIKYSNTKRQRLRWTFILAQLQELNKEPQDAYKNYSSVVRSNASFEMAFNADLNRIRLEDNQANRHLTRMGRLRELLRDDKNGEFIDQIYYQMALIYLADNDIDNAVKNLQLSLRNSNRNQNQKGLTYLKLADISFKNNGDYVKAKKYYDSTLLNLSPAYPDYTLIQKKSNNLQILADQLQIIGREDTLQTLAKLNEQDRATRIDEMVARHMQQMQAAALSTSLASNAYSNSTQQSQSTGGTSNFYFYNTNAISQGFSDFKKIWGNRKLEDNWRRSKHTGGDITANTSNIGANTDPDSAPQVIKTNADDISSGIYRQNLLQNIPLTQQKLDQSNQRVYTAYTNIANFYRDILGDKKEAIEAYEGLLTRYPDDPNKPAIYYNLYRLYSDSDPAKSNYYKDLLIKNYPNNLYTKVISDPDYSLKLDNREAELTALYNEVYDLYTKHKYTALAIKADSLLKIYPNGSLAAQLSYLRAIANGHQEKFEPFRDELLAVTTKYPNDKLITPLINQHIVYIEANKQKMTAREFALVDNDPSEEPFIPATVQTQMVVNQQAQTPQVQPKTTPPANAIVNKPVTQPVIANAPVTKPASNPVTNPPATTSAPIINNPVTINPAINNSITNNPISSIFSLKDSTNYYFVVNVSAGNVNLASSRFGIGQFNRANYAGNPINHQLKDAGNDNQLIYVGRFYSLTAAKGYARVIVPLLPQIMKVPATKYMFFMITQENLNKLADKKTLDSYIDFYQKNY